MTHDHDLDTHEHRVLGPDESAKPSIQHAIELLQRQLTTPEFRGFALVVATEEQGDMAHDMIFLGTPPTVLAALEDALDHYGESVAEALLRRLSRG